MGIMYRLVRRMKISSLLVSTDKGDLRDVIEILTEIPSLINTKSRIGNSLLIMACKNSHTKIAYFLVKMGADLNVRGDGGLTALHYAIGNNMLVIVELLLNTAADIRIKDNNGNRPLDIITPDNAEIYTLIKEFAAAFSII